MQLPRPWVDALFARLSVRYGSAFLRQWPDADPEVVKADWADVLGGFASSPDAIKHGIEHLDPNRPPTALQFREICRRAPTPPALAIAGPDVKADPERVKAMLAALSEPSEPGMTPAERVAQRLRQIERITGGKLSAAQRSMLDACERRGEVSAVTGDFTPIPRDALPPGMRAA